MSDKIPLMTIKEKSPFTSGFLIQFSAVLPWLICGLAAAFYCYEYLLRITPGVMVPELQKAFSLHGQYLDATLIGHLSAFYYYAYTPMQLPVGLFMDRYGPRGILTFAVLCCAVGTVMFGTTDSWWVAAFGRFWIGFGSAFAFVGVLKLASTWLPPNRFAMVSGLTTTLGMLGATTGNIFMTELVQSIGWKDTIIYSSYIGFVLVPIIWLIVRNDPSDFKITAHVANKTHAPNTTANCLSYRQLWNEIYISMRNKQIWLNGIIGGLLMAPTVVFPELWGKLYLQTVHNFAPLEASRAVALIFMGWAVGGPIAGFLSDWVRRRRFPLLFGALLTTILLAIFLFYPDLSPWEIKILLFLIGVTSSVEVICFAIGRENCPLSLSGTVIAVTNFLVVSFSFSQVLVAKILDMTWDNTMVDQARVYSVESYQTAMLILPVATALAFILSFFLKETFCRPLASTVRT